MSSPKEKRKRWIGDILSADYEGKERDVYRRVRLDEPEKIEPAVAKVVNLAEAWRTIVPSSS